MKLDDDDFTLLGLPRRHGVDRAALDAAWRRLQGEVHPDRFAAQGAAAQRVAMQWAVRVNEAYQRLKDPLARAAYLCELRGAAVDAERNTAMPTSFLMQQMQWREALEEAADLAAVEALDAEVAAAERALLADVERRLDTEDDAAAAAADVRALMFVNRFRQDIERRLDALDPTR
ncbi:MULTISPECIES: Fe-S protein assembly co-chaperone HscB [Rubrivivax]|uniref:Co-chaperone protein HscB homolog n=1 Tax=Rubrivivax benzoatilyticus TaxID=316997 RepID=A0ABX0HTK0_9BURK|nr:MULTISPECIES: Fe-S protein assembly co-chaperone HscB [Rubrivivax]EGJ11171.1 co-chaperone Hsc20 [Rubrivivax benzoatilyticus JA2 = ATCC BAA-35]NHK97636.1 Fe-S protein assembly co-chaperone HscB [Rubrivivax benzoatilyticus]NHL22669.1 Fe-S protein assembly co-chaperone HscB [Rubrivivax benzoatilyticus]